MKYRYLIWPTDTQEVEGSNDFDVMFSHLRAGAFVLDALYGAFIVSGKEESTVISEATLFKP